MMINYVVLLSLLSKYVSIRDVAEGALKICQDMLGLTFEMVAGKFEDGASNKQKSNNSNTNDINDNGQ